MKYLIEKIQPYFKNEHISSNREAGMNIFKNELKSLKYQRDKNTKINLYKLYEDGRRALIYSIDTFYNYNIKKY